MKKLVINYVSGFSLFSSLFMLQAPPISAHDLQQNNGIVAVLHVLPDDKPLAGAPTKFELLFSKNIGGFQLNNYTTTLRVLDHNKQLQQVPVTPEFYGAADKGTATVNFPKIDEYQIVLTGTSKTQAEPNFKMTYPLTVTDAVNKSTAGVIIPILIMTGILVGAFSILILKKKK